MVESATALVTEVGNVLVVGRIGLHVSIFRIYIKTMHEAMALGDATVTTQVAFWVICTYTSVSWHK